MDGLIEQAGELRGGLQSLLVASHDSVLLKNTNNCAKELGNDLVVRSLVALENFPFDIFVGQSGIAGDLKKYTDIILDTPTLSVQYSETTNLLTKELSSEVADLQLNIIRILRHILNQYSHQIRDINLVHLQVLVDTIYFKTPTTKLKVEALKLMENALPSFKNQKEEYPVEKLADRYFKELTRATKLYPTVQAQVKIILGKIIQVFPERLGCTVNSLPERLLNNYITYLATTVNDKTGKKLDLTLLEGTLKGLCLLIDGVGFNVEEDCLNLEKLYDALKKICKLPDQEADVKRRGAMREGLSLFAMHHNLFSRIILKDVSFWYNEIMKWRESRNKDDSLAGQRAITGLFDTVNLGLSNSPSKIDETMPSALQFFVDKFRVIMKYTERSTAKDISLAILGYGQFSKLLARYLPSEEYRKLCLDIVSSTERFHIESDETTQDKWRNEFHCHLKSIGSLISDLDSPSPPILHALESLCLQLIRKYPYIPYQFHTTTNNALLSVLYACPKEVGQLLENLVYHGLVESCSYPAVPEYQILPPEVVSYKKFLPLWIGLLKKHDNNNRTKIFEVYMTSFIEIIDKLDLTVLDNIDDDQPTISDNNDDIEISQTQNENDAIAKLDLEKMHSIQQGKRARVCKDYTILVNIIDLSLAVIDTSTDLVKGWIDILWEKVSAWSYQHPEASRFYPLIAKIITLANLRNDEKNILTLSVQQFFKHHFTRMNFFDQTELRIAAYTLVASIPVQVVAPLLTDLPQAVEKVLELSESVPDLANKMLKTLLCILDNFQENILDKLLRTVMPQLRTFLSWRSSRVENKEIRKSKSGPIKDKTKKSGGEKLHLQNLEEENCNLALDILARVSSKYKELVLPTTEQLGEHLTAWDTRNHLTVEVPLPDVLLPVHLDPLLPKVVRLVQQTADRKARVAAGESLHALLLLMIGRTSQQTDDMASKAPMVELFKRVFPVVLKLASDSDSVIQGLFQPLFYQIIHWFTKDAKRGSQETECLLEALINTICSSKDMELKMNAGSYLQEYVIWSIKQSKANSTGNVNIKSLLNRLYFLLRHPHVNKRLGGCVVFSQIYRIFREDKILVSEYLLEILSSFLQCLIISQADPPFSATIPECEKNIGHIKRILFHQNIFSIFQKECKWRRIPVNMDPSGTVPSINSWLLDFLTDVEHPAARRAAIILVNDLCQKSQASLRRTLETKYGTIANMLDNHVLPPMKDVLTERKDVTIGMNAKEYNAYSSVFELACWLLDTYTCKFDEIRQIQEFINSFVKRFTMKVEKAELLRFESVMEKHTCILSFWTLLAKLIKDGYAEDIINANKTHLHETIIPLIVEPNQQSSLKVDEKQQFFDAAIALLKALKVKAGNYYQKLVMFFTQAYMETKLFNLNDLLEGCFRGRDNRYIFQVYTQLAEHKLLIDNTDTESLLPTIIDKLPDNVTDLNNIKQNVLNNLKVYVKIISKLKQSNYEKIVNDLALSVEPKHIWFINAFGECFVGSIIKNIDHIVTYHLNINNGINIHDIFIMFSKLLNSTRDAGLGRAFLDCFFSHWPAIISNSNSRSTTLKVIHLLRKISEGIKIESHPKSSLIVSWFGNLMKNEDIHLKIKYKVLQLLCLILKLAPDQETIKEVLDGLAHSRTGIPTFSSELMEGTVQYELYIMIFKQLLASLEASKSTGLLFFIISVVCKDKKNICLDMIYSSITNTILNTKDPSQQIQLLEVPYSIFSDETGIYSFQAKLAAVSKFVVPCLQACSPMAIRRFFLNNIEFMLVQINKTDNRLTGNEDKKKENLVTLVGVVQMVGVMYSKLEPAFVHEPGGTISQKAATIIREKNMMHVAKANGKEMSTYILRFLKAARTWQAENTWPDQIKVLLREFHSHCLNCVIAIISCTNTNEKVYNNYIFMENKGSNELLWNRIMDTESKIRLDMVFEKALTTRKDYVSIKHSYNDIQYLLTSASQQFHYLSDSSLSQDVSRYDYTGTMSQAASLQDRQAENSSADDNNNSPGGSYIDIELDDFGQVLCMSQLIAVANYMQANKIYQEPTENFEKATEPGWMTSIINSLQDKQSHRNSKLFLLSFIFKCSDLFCPFAVRFYKVILESIVGDLEGVCVDGKLNYLAVDLILMLLAWSDRTGTRPDSEGHLVTKLLALIMNNVVNAEDVRVFKMNIEIVSAIVEKWRPCLRTGSSFSYLQDLLSRQDDQNMQKGARYLLSVFLAHNYVDMDIIKDVNFIKNIVGKPKGNMEMEDGGNLQGFYSKTKDVYQKSGVCAGLLLKILQTDSQAFDDINKVVIDRLNHLSQLTTVEGKSRLLLILHGVQKGFPGILDDFASRFKYSLKTMKDDDLHLCLEMFETHCQHQLTEPNQSQDNLKTELNMMGLKQYLQDYQPSVKLLALKILKTCHMKLDVNVAFSYYDAIKDFLTSKYSQHRKVYVEIMKERYSSISLTDTINGSIKNTCLIELLKALNDKDEDIQSDVFTFLNTRVITKSDSFERMVEILHNIESSTETSILQFLAGSILSQGEQLPTFKQALFRAPLDQCQFRDYNVADTTWRSQFAGTLMPMFADSLASQQQSQMGGSAATYSSTSTAGTPMLRATQVNMAFSQTQGNLSVGNIHGPLVNGQANSNPVSVTFLPSDIARKRVKVGNLEGGRRLVKDYGSQAEQAKKFSKLAERNKVQMLNIEEDRRKSQEKNVRLMRKYRTGDLPDIQILVSDLIRPILSLARYSSQVASTLCADIIQGVIVGNEDLITDEWKQMFLTAINKILKDGIGDNKTLAETFLNICLGQQQQNSLAADLLLDTAYGGLDIRQVGKVAAQHGLSKLGILILEKFYMTLEAKDQKKFVAKQEAKRSKLSEDSRVDLILCLVDLLKSEGESENMKGLLQANSDQLNIHPLTKKALSEESSLDWSKALKTYRSLVDDKQLNESHLSQEVALWHKGYYDSMTKMGMWEQVNLEIGTRLENVDLWSLPYSDSVISGWLTSAVHLGTAGESKCEALFNFINNSVTYNQTTMEQNYPFQLAAIAAVKEKYFDAARIVKEAIISSRLKLFGQDDGNLNSSGNIHSLQVLLELSSYLNQLESGRIDINRTENVWTQCHPVPGTSGESCIKDWDSILTTRTFFINKLSSQSQQIKYDNLMLLKNALAMNYVNLGLTAIEDKNPKYAKRGMDRLRSLGAFNDEVKCCERSLISRIVSYNNGKRDNMTAVDSFCFVFKQLAKSYDGEKSGKLMTDTKDLFHCLLEIVDEEKQIRPSAIIRQLRSTEQASFNNIFANIEDNNEKLKENIVFKVLDFFMKAHKAESYSVADDLMQGANFTHELWRKERDKLEDGGHQFSLLSVRYHLKAMELGSLTARQMFPRCLDLVKNGDNKQFSCQDEFVEGWSKVPVWMLIPWRNQLISCLDTLSSTFTPLLLRMVEEYPHALAYSILASISTSHDLSDEALSAIYRLKDKCDGYSMYEKLVESMKYLVHPAILIYDLASSVEFNMKEFPKNYQIRVAQEFQNFKAAYLESNENMIGQVFTKYFSNDVKTKLEKLVSKCDVTGLKELYQRSKESIRGSYKLADLSPYLAEFLASNHSVQVEVPGQYDNFYQPLPNQHVLLSSFAPSVSVFDSIRKPMLLTILGSDGRKYPFIAKAGEDIRLDQRIENLFSLCNVCINGGNQKGSNSVNIRTYNVIPLSDKLGLIEFVRKTSPVWDFLSLAKMPADINDASNRLLEGLKKKTKKNQPRQAYLEGLKLRSQDIVDNYEAAVACTDTDHLRVAMLKLSSGHQQFYILRNNFVSSYAVVSTIQWILGIGDRHLSNYLICKKTASIVPIDFGYSFGLGTSYLEIPELVQLRLTPQILCVLQPSSLTGLFRETMIKVLNNLKDNKDMLMAVMDVFVQEPTLDWNRMASSQSKKKGSSDETLFAKQRVDLAKAKLEGGHPSMIMIQELKAGKARESMDKLIKCIKGSRIMSDKQDNMSSLEQVDILINQSMDPNLLGRMWVGWRPHA